MSASATGQHIISKMNQSKIAISVFIGWLILSLSFKLLTNLQNAFFMWPIYLLGQVLYERVQNSERFWLLPLATFFEVK